MSLWQGYMISEGEREKLAFAIDVFSCSCELGDGRIELPLFAEDIGTDRLQKHESVFGFRKGKGGSGGE